MKYRKAILEILRADLTRSGVPDLKTSDDYHHYLETVERALGGEVVIPGYTKQENIRTAREIYPKVRLFYFLISPAKATEDDPLLKDKHLTESIQKLREFVRQLWPKKKKRGRMIETDMDWFETEDREVSGDNVRFTKEER